MRFTRWDQLASTETTNEIVKVLSLVHASRISDETERKRAIDLLDRSDFLSLCDLDPAYGNCSVNDAIQIRQINAFFKKRSDLEFGIDRTAVARGKFKEAEALCLETNHVIELVSRGEFSFLRGVEARIFRAQRKIASILGEVPKLEDLKPRFGPGATTQIPKRMASARRKLSKIPACSEELLPLVRECLEELQAYVTLFDDEEERDTCLVPVEIHTGKLAFVRKTAKIDRPVVVEPWLNGVYQLAVGDYVTERLRWFGVDIRDQTRNQSLARLGSLLGELATLDLSSASDTIAYNLIGLLLPIDWVIFLSHFRTGCVWDGERLIRLQKFSSMGNGFTFPLETLIFYALAIACVDEDQEHNVSVYGDDIIMPVSGYDDMLETLRVLGFIPNPEKSFATGPFRESCGADYLSGINIRPVYVKTALAAFDLFRLHNFYKRKCDEECASICLSYLDPSIVKWGPDGYGDGHLIHEEWRLRCGSPFKRDRGWSGYVFETYTFRPKKDFQVLPGDRVLPSYSIYLSPPSDCEVRRVRTDKSYLQKIALDFSLQKERPSSVFYGKDGALGVSLPGVRGYKSIKIYTLNP